MIDSGLVVAVLLVEAAVIVAAVLLTVGHSIVRSRLERSRTVRVAAARAAVIGSLEATSPTPAALEAVRALPPALRVDLLADIGRSLSGALRTRVGDIAGTTGTLSGAARLTHSRRWRSRLRGARLFTTLGGGGEHVGPLLDDPRPEVRAQAIEWASDHATPGIVARLLDLLGRGDALSRYAVRDTLRRLGPAAVRPIEAQLENVSGTAALPILQVAVPVAAAGMLPAALRLAGDPDPAVRARAGTLLAALGGTAAVDALERLLGDPDDAVRADAARGLGRLGAWQSGTALAECLGDPAWDVRQGAALSLRALGSPGLLLLRRALQHEDRFARDIARQVLDLPGSVEAFLP